MSDNDRPSGAETDWYASCVQCYGFGYTREQALLEMAFHLDGDRENPLEVDLVEHIGEFSHGIRGWSAEQQVNHEVVEIAPKDVEELRYAAEAAAEAELILERSDRIE